MRSAFFLTFLIISSCASSLDQLQVVRNTAPDWYEDRKQEIRGDSYPRIADVPVITAETRPGQGLAMSQAETLAAMETFRSDPRTAGPEETAAQMQAWVARNKVKVERQIPPAEFWTDAEIAALRARFDSL